MSHDAVDVGLDIGSTSIKAVAVPAGGGAFLAMIERPLRGQLEAGLRALLNELSEKLPGREVQLAAVTGSSAAPWARALEVEEVNEIIAACHGGGSLVPGAGAILELGGEHSKFIRLEVGDTDGERTLRDFHVNSVCSAGTGAFLEQEAHRLNMAIGEFSERAASAESAVRLAGRCAVFAKTDAVHKHQNGVPLNDIAYALCLAIVRNVVGDLVAGRPFEGPLAVVGGVVANRGVRRALRETTADLAHEVVVPAEHAYADAIGALIAVRDRHGRTGPTLKTALARLGRVRVDPHRTRKILRPLGTSIRQASWSLGGTTLRRPEGAEVDGALGIDIGSTTTNLAWLSTDGGEIDWVTVPTRGEALAAVQDCFAWLEQRHGRAMPRAVGVTGSGRKLVAEMVGADLAINEITAHAAGGAHFYPEVDSIVDIGGQDSKFIALHDGVVVGFEMNKVCSAGTGSFIEEMAELLGLDIADEFQRAATSSKRPSDLGERCTVFMSSEIMRRLREGSHRADLAAGLCYSIVHNYLTRVVRRHSIGDRILFQGGVANNRAVVAAFESVTGRELEVHRFNEAAGAVGAALLAGRAVHGASTFRGLDGLDTSEIRSRWFECRQCTNSCPIHITAVPSGARFLAGGLCDRYETLSPGNEGANGESLFAAREASLARGVSTGSPGGPMTLGVPRALFFNEMLPFWSSFLTELEVDHVFSTPTTRAIVAKGAGLCHTTACLPLKIAYGHCADLIEQGVRRLLVPSLASLDFRTATERLDHLCPTVQGWPYTAKALLGDDVEFLSPRLRLAIPRVGLRDMLALGNVLGKGTRETLAALERAKRAQNRFGDEMVELGDRVLADIPASKTPVVILGRSYTIADPTIWMQLERVLSNVNLVGIPMDLVRDQALHSTDLSGMYWYYGKRLLQVARVLESRGDLPVIFLSTFSCGPDAFIIHMLRRELGDTPLLELELDEHSDFTGIHTRIEAFKHSLGGRRARPAPRPAQPREMAADQLARHQLLIPRMSEHAYAFSGAFQSCGVDARVLPLPDEDSLAAGKAVLGGNECLPCAYVMGDMLRHLEDRGRDELPPAFFMVSGDGPCRLGQYPWLQRVILDEHGHEDVPIFNASQDPRFYEQLGVVANDFKRRVWRGWVAADLLFRKWRESRSQALDRAAADGAYQYTIGRLESCLADGGDVRVVVERGFERFEELPSRPVQPTITIGVLGENYIRCNSVANNQLADILEDLGVTTWFPSMCEWVYYTNWTARLHCAYERQPLRRLQLLAIDAMQRLDERRIERIAKNRLRNRQRPSVARIFKLASRYVPRTFEGETIVGIGRTLDMYERGAGGVIHVAPFGCMVGGIVKTLSERMSEDLNGFPILNVEYDGKHSELTRSKLEGFVHRAKLWQGDRRRSA